MKNKLITFAVLLGIILLLGIVGSFDHQAFCELGSHYCYQKEVKKE